MYIFLSFSVSGFELGFELGLGLGLGLRLGLGLGFLGSAESSQLEH